MRVNIPYPTDAWKEGTVVRHLAPRSYEVAVGDRTYVRNRRQLRTTQKSTHSIPTQVANPNRTRQTTSVSRTTSEKEEEKTPPQQNFTETQMEVHTSPYKTRYGRSVKPPTRLIYK